LATKYAISPGLALVVSHQGCHLEQRQAARSPGVKILFVQPKRHTGLLAGAQKLQKLSKRLANPVYTVAQDPLDTLGIDRSALCQLPTNEPLSH
jgi:hypothetical protein